MGDKINAMNGELAVAPFDPTKKKNKKKVVIQDLAELSTEPQMEKFGSKPVKSISMKVESVDAVEDRDYPYNELIDDDSLWLLKRVVAKSAGIIKAISSQDDEQKVDLSKLEMPALLKYWRHYNLVDAIPNPSKDQLIDIVQRHFMSQQVDELQVIAGFVQAVNRMKKAWKLESK